MASALRDPHLQEGGLTVRVPVVGFDGRLSGNRGLENKNFH
jgi:hypothetical protein